MIETNKRSIFKSVLFVVPCFLVFLLSQILTTLLLTLICIVLNAIPIINNLLDFITNLRGESLTVTITIISVFVAYILTTFVQDKIIKIEENKKLSRKILGVIIVIIHIISFIYNLTSEGNILANVISTIAGLVFISNNNE